jgi:hypothetical protein
MEIVAGILVALFFIVLLIGIPFWISLEYKNKKLNNFRNWLIKPTRKRWWQNLIDPFLETMLLQHNEIMVAAIDFYRYPQPFLSFDDWYHMMVYLTSERLILSRMPLFIPIKIYYKTVNFCDIKDSAVIETRFFGITSHYLRITLRTGEIYQIAPNHRWFGKDRIDHCAKLLSFFRDKNYLCPATQQ